MATELGQAYVQIMPSAKGIKGSIEKELGGEATSAGKSAGGMIASTIKKVIAVAAIGKAISASLTAGGGLQQSLGGVETLFKENADKVKQYANEAYKTAGVSANDYMENVISFSASLLQSLGGDTEAAAEKANTAMIDMADNSNKMGTSMESIQNAYKGFSKENYTMLDNLSLGYGGTKKEMERLLVDAEKLTGVKYDINNLADVYDAIHAVQVELGITGTTALESAETLTGSFASMKGAFTNFLGNLSLGEDVGPSLQALAETVSTFLFGNFLPMVGNILMALPEAIATFIQAAAPKFLEGGMEFISQLSSGVTTGLPELLTSLENMVVNAMRLITEKLPTFLEKGVEIITNIANGILKSIPNIVETAGIIIVEFIEFLIRNFPIILSTGKDLILNLVKGIINNMPAIGESAIKAISRFIDTIIENLPQFLKTGTKIIIEFVAGIIKMLPDIIASAVTLVANFVGMLISKIPDVFNAGVDIVKGLWEGIKSMGSWIGDKVTEFASGIANSFKKFFGIQSPSTLMAEFGKNIDEGLAVGIEANEDMPINKIKDLSKKMADEAKKAVQETMRIFEEGMTLAKNRTNALISLRDAESEMAEREGRKVLGNDYYDNDDSYDRVWSDGMFYNSNVGYREVIMKRMAEYGGYGYDIDDFWDSEIGQSLNRTKDKYNISDNEMEAMTNVAKQQANITQNITINSPTALSPSETARQVKNASRELAMGV